MLVVSSDDLRPFVERALEAVGVPHDRAALVAEPIVWTNLRALDSHGVQLLPYYVQQVERGFVDPLASGRVVRETGACLSFDGQMGFGQITSRACCDHAVRLAAAAGIGIVAARDCTHFGPAGFWSYRISQAGYIGIALCDASMQVPPWQGREPRLGTNPISVAVPHPNGEGWLLDMATTTVSYGKLEHALLKGAETLPYGWAVDREGVPATEASRVLDGGLLMPLGGYNGYGLAMMVEILTGVLAGGEVFGTRVAGLRDKKRPMHANQTFIAIDPARFLPPGEFEKRMDWLVGEIKSSKPARGYDEVLVAGDPEWRAQAERSRGGIPIHEGVWRTVVEMADRLNVPLPPVRPLPA